MKTLHYPVNSPWFPFPTNPTLQHTHINLTLCRHHPPISLALRRHHRRRRNPNPKQNTIIPTPYQNFHISNPDKPSISISIPKFTKLHEFVNSGTQAFTDLQTLITIDSDQKVVISCQRSTIRFIGGLVMCGLIIVVVFRALGKLGLGFRKGDGGGVVKKRDRSLGGREVVVGKSQVRVSGTVLKDRGLKANSRIRKEQKLPNWWPASISAPIVTVDKQEYQRKADGLIRAILDYRMSGMDILEDDIIQLHRLCRVSGVRVLIEPANARDSFYRSSVDFILNICAGQSRDLHIDGESAREFIVGLADNIGLEKIRAARMVAAAVAARTRSSLLQAWALDIQGRYSEAVVELSKLCHIHKMFPPEECSPEMEMVARGLEKHLKLEQRDYLMKTVIDVCGEESRRSMAEALGLCTPMGTVGHQQETV